MLPSFRFLFTAIMLSTSILVFGLGAAALLRTAHEEFASNPFWHAAPATTFPQQSDGSRSVLAMLRVDPVPVEPRAGDDAASVAATVEPAARSRFGRSPTRRTRRRRLPAPRPPAQNPTRAPSRSGSRRAGQRNADGSRLAARQAAQQAADPFAQPIAQPAAVARSR